MPDLPDGSIDPKAVAGDLAASLVAKHTEGEPTPLATPPVEPQPEPDQLYTPDPEPALEPHEWIKQEYAEGNIEPEPVAPVAKPIMVEDEEITDEIYHELLGFGVDLGVPPSQVHPQNRETYERMASTVINVVTEHRMEQLAQAQKAMQLEDFMKKVEENPANLLKLMMVNKPEAFAEAIELYQTLQDNPREKELLQRELEVEARQEAMKREAQASNQAQAQQKAARVKALTTRAATLHNVNPAIAAQLVAMEVRNTRGREPSPTRINELVGQLRQQAPVATPAKQAAVAATPTQPLARQEGTPLTRVPAVETPPGQLTPGEPLRFRNLVKAANQRIARAEREQ